MNERILEGIMDEIGKHNQIQEGIRHEMELQNDLKVNAMLNDERLYSHDFIEMGIDDVTREKLYAKLSDEDRSILERYRKMNTNANDELELYSITLKGFPHENGESKVEETVEKLHLGILDDVYTEKELFEYFERVIERSGALPLSLEWCWETEWKDHKANLMDKDEEDSYFDFRDFDEEEVKEYKQEFMRMYENRIAKGYLEKKEEERKRKEKEFEKLIQEREERKRNMKG